jgi:AsmA family protein
MRRFRLLMYGVITLFVLGVIGAGLVSLFFDLNSLKPTLAEAAFDATGRELAIDGDIELSLFPRPRATATGVRLSNTAGGSEPDAVTIDIVSAQVAWFPLLAGTVDVRQIHASGVRVLVEDGANQKASLAFAAPESASGSEATDDAPLPNLISVSDLTVVLRDGADDQEFHVSRLAVRPQGNDGQTDAVVALDRNGMHLIAEGTVGSLNAIAGPDPFPIELTIEVAGSTLRVQGTLSDADSNPAMDLSLSAQGPSLMALSPIVGARVPLDKEFDLSARLQGSVETLAVRELVLSVGSARVTGETTLDLSGARPRLSGHLRSSNLDLAQFAGDPSSAGNDREGSGGPILTDAPLPFGFTRRFDADLTFDVEAAEVLGLSLRNVALVINNEDGLATIETLAADLANGSLSASGRLDARNDEVGLSLNAQVTGLDVAKILETFNIPGTSAQQASAGLELTSRGTTARALADNISASVRLSELAITFDDAARLVLKDASARFEGRDRPINIAAGGTLRGEAVAMDGKLDPISAYQPGNPYTFQLTARAAGATAEVQADMRAAMVDGLTLRTAIRGASLADLSRITATDLPTVGPYEVAGTVSFADDAIRIEDAAIRLAGSDLRGDIAFNSATDRLNMVVDVRADFIDLTAFGVAAATSSELNPDGENEALGETPLDITPLLALDAQFTLVAQTVMTSALRVENVSLEIASDSESVRLERLSAELDGKTVVASGSARPAAAGIAVAIQGDISSVDATPLIASSGLANRVEIGELTISSQISSAGATPVDLLDAAQGEIVVNDLRFAFKSERGLVHDPITLSALRIATKGRGTPVTFESQGALGGEALEVTGTLAPVAELRLMRPVALDISMATTSSQLRIKGVSPESDRTREIGLSVVAEGLIVREMAYAAGLVLDPDGPWRLQAALKATETSVDVTSLEVAVGQSDFSGHLSMARTGEDRHIAARLTSENFSLADFIQLDAGDPGQEPAIAPSPRAEPVTGPVFSRAPIAFAPLRRIDVDIGVQIKSFAGRSITGKDLSLTLNGRSGLFTLDRFAAIIDGEPISGQASADLRGDDALLSASLVGGPIDVGRLAFEVTRSSDLARRVSLPIELDVQLQGTGRSPHAIASTATGVIGLTGGNGFIRQKGIKFLDQGLLRQLTPWAKEAGDRTNINCLVSHFDVNEGVADARTMLLDAEFLSVAGKGTIDLGEETLNLTLTPRPKEVRLLDLAVPVAVTGPINAPNALPTAGGTAKKVVTTLGIFVNPLVLLVPVIEGVTADKNPCLAAVEQAESGESKPGGAVGGAIRGVGRGIGRILGKDRE